MADASYLQTSFLGGQWSKWMQGRADDPRYSTAMNVCLNGYPVEEGSWVRRQGTMHLGYTRAGNQARLFPFDVHETQPYTVEVSSDHLRIWFGNQLVCTNDPQTVISISTDNPAVVTTALPHGWSSGDMVQIGFADATNSAVGALLRNRQFVITVTGPQQFTIADGVTNQGIDGSQVGITGTPTMTATRILDFGTPWNWSDIYPALRSVQTENTAFFLAAGHQPYQLVFTETPNSGQFAQFSFSPANFIDGPYLDWVEGSICNVNATSGEVEVTVSYLPWLAGTVYDAGAIATYNSQDWKSLVGGNIGQTPQHGSSYWVEASAGSAIGPNGFQGTDVGRSMRFLVAPNPWLATTAYSTGNTCLYNNIAYTALQGSTGVEPDVSPDYWEVSPSLYFWTWGKVASIVSESQANVWIIGAPFINANVTIYTWMMGAYSDTTGWPTCGCYHEGRLWLGGSAANRIDSSHAGNPLNFAPTETDGTVTDADAISYLLESEGTNPILWMHPSAQGIICETKMGEWLVQASAMNDPLTPTTVQAHIMTHYGGADVLPVQAGLSTVFVQKFGKSVMEYLADVFTGRYIAPNLSEVSRDIGSRGFAELAYQLEETPIVWARLNDGTLAGMTFRRKSSFATELPAFAGWHVHELGSGFSVLSICVSSNVDGTMKALTMVTEDPGNNNCHVERLTDMFTPGAPLTDAWFLDNAVTPSGSQAETINGVQGTTYYGLNHLNGKLATVWAGGLDCGDYTVENGQVFVPFTVANPFYTQAYMNSLSGSYSFGTPLDYSVAIEGQASSVAPKYAAQSLDHMFGIDVPLAASPAAMWTIPYIGNSGTPSTTLIDFGNYRVWNTTPLTPYGGGLIVSDLITGEVLGHAQYASAPNVWLPPEGLEAPGGNGGSGSCVGTDGAFYYMTNGTYGGQAAILMKATLADGQIVRAGYFGTTALVYGFQKFSPTTMAMCQSIAGVFAGGNYIVGFSQEGDGTTGGTGAHIGVINADTMAFAGAVFPVNSQTGVVCAGPQGANLGIAYGLDSWGVDQAGQPNPHLYVVTISAQAANYPGAPAWSSTRFYQGGQQVSYKGALYTAQYLDTQNLNQEPDTSPTYWAYTPNAAISCLTLAPIAASDIDPAWAPFGAPSGGPGPEGPTALIYDASDGNVITTFNSTIGGAPVLVKISTTTGKIMWRLPLSQYSYEGPIQGSRVENGILLLWANGHLLGPTIIGRVDTATGTITSNYSLYGVQQTYGALVSDDESGNVFIISSATFNDTSGVTPTLMNGSQYSETPHFTVLTPGNIAYAYAKSVSRDTIPVVIGQKYISQGQLLRPLAPQSIGATNGPGLGKTRRAHMISMLVEGSISGTMEIGTDFDGTLQPANYTYPNGSPYDLKTLFSGVYLATLNDDYSFDSRPCWQIARPYPCTVNAVEAFLHTQDR